MYINSYIYSYLNFYIYPYTYSYIYSYIYSYNYQIYARTYTYTYTYTYANTYIYTAGMIVRLMIASWEFTSFVELCIDHAEYMDEMKDGGDDDDDDDDEYRKFDSDMKEIERAEGKYNDNDNDNDNDNGIRGRDSDDKSEVKMVGFDDCKDNNGIYTLRGGRDMK